MQSAPARSTQQTMAVANVRIEVEVERVGIRAPICLTIFPFLRFSALASNGKNEKRNKSNDKSTENYSSESCSCGGYRHQYAIQSAKNFPITQSGIGFVCASLLGRRMRAHTLHTDIFQPKSPPALLRVSLLVLPYTYSASITGARVTICVVFEAKQKMEDPTKTTDDNFLGDSGASTISIIRQRLLSDRVKPKIIINFLGFGFQFWVWVSMCVCAAYGSTTLSPTMCFHFSLRRSLPQKQ